MSATEEEDTGGINNLPDELIVSILKLLPLESLLCCEKVCHRWRKLCQDSSIWRPIVIVFSGKPGQTEVRKKNFEIISTHNEYIHCLKLQYVYNYNFLKSVLFKCDNLISLDIVMCRIGKDFEDDIIRWPNLKRLNLKNSLLLLSDVELIIPYDQFKYLKYLALSDFGLSNSNCDTLLHCAKLSHILIEKIKGLSLEFIEKLIVSKQHILETFHIYGGDSVNNNCLNLLSKCLLLKDLAIIRCENLTDEGLVSLVGLKNIQHLQIWNNTSFTELKLLKTLGDPNLVKMQSLSLSRIQNISPVIVDIISEYYVNLKFLALYQCPAIINTDYEKQLKSKFRKIDVVLY